MADILPVEADAAVRHIVKAQQQLEQSGLARAGRADQRDGFAGGDVQRDVVQCGRLRARRVVEADPLEADRRLPWLRQRLRRGGLNEGGLRVQQFQQALGRPRRPHHVTPHFRHRAHAARDQRRVEHERGQLPAGHAACMHLVRADPQHEDDGAHHRGDDQHGHCRAHARAPDRGNEARFRAAGEALGFLRLLRIGLHRRHGVEYLAGQRRSVGDLVLRFARQLLHPAADGEDWQHQQGHQPEVQREQIEAGDRQHDHAADKLEQAAQAHRNGAADHGLDQRGVARQPR